MLKNKFSLIFQEGPIGRAYLNFFKLNKIMPNKIYYLYKKKFLPRGLNLRIFFQKKNFYALKNLGFNQNLCNDIENFFNFKKNFISDMYKFELINEFKDNIVYIPDENINSSIIYDKLLESNEENFLNTSNQIYKKTLDTKKNFYHVHPGYLPKSRGADGSLNSILYHGNLGVSFFKMTKEIDIGDIYLRKIIQIKKFNLNNYSQKDLKDVYRIWFSFFDPIIRTSLLKNIFDDNFKFSPLDVSNEKSSYYSFLNENDLKKVFDSIFL